MQRTLRSSGFHKTKTDLVGMVNGESKSKQSKGLVRSCHLLAYAKFAGI